MRHGRKQDDKKARSRTCWRITCHTSPRTSWIWSRYRAVNQVPMPKGLEITDSGEYLVNGRPIEESEEGRAWLEDQQKRANWGPAMALSMLSLGRIPGGAPPGAIGAFKGQRPTSATTRPQI